MIDTLRLTRRGETAARRTRDLRRRALCGLPRRDRRARRGAPLLPPRLRRLRRRGDPDRRQGRDRDERDPHDRRLEDPRGLRAGLRLDRRRAAEGARAPHPRQDEHRRVRDGLLDRELGLRPDAQPVGSLAGPRRLGRRLGGGRQRRPRTVGARLRHRRLDQAAVRALRQRRPASDVRHRLPLRRRRLRLEPRPGRPGRAHRPRLRLPLLDHRRARRVRHDDGRAAAPGRAAGRDRPEGASRRRPQGAEPGRGDRARRRGGGASRDREARGARRRGGGVLAAALRRVRDGLLLPDHAGRGVVQPRPLRRRPLRLPRRRDRAAGDVRAHARRGVRRRAEAADHGRARTRSRPATTTRTTARRRRCGR